MTTYRNDHEATLARVDALERELDTVRKRAATPVTTKARTRRSGWGVFAASLIALVAGTTGGIVLGLSSSEPEATRVASTPTDRSVLDHCANAIRPTPTLDHEVTDPRAPHPISVDAIRAGAACRDELRALLDRGGLSPAERDALWKWAVQEDELAGAISRIEVYYASDPYRLDNYSTAKQLWLEYNRAHDCRDRALAEWRARFNSA